MPFSPFFLKLRVSDPQMLLLQQQRLVISSSRTILMASKHLLKSTPSTLPLKLNLSLPGTISAFPLKPNSRILPISLKTFALSYTSHSNVPGPVYSENPEDTSNFSARLNVLKKKLEVIGFDTQMLKTGQDYAVWICHRGKCGWRGNIWAFVNDSSSYGRLNQITKIKPKREITEKSLGLKPLCSEIVAYFGERMISEKTLARNSVMQKTYGDQFIIAFTYRRNGVLVSCKYRDVNKNFWQEKDTEKIFYGVDDIKEASGIIIVEGEIDKLSMEEAGFYNCVSVPDGAPPSVSTKVFESEEKDIKYQYLWNCKEYLEQIIWPKKNEVEHFKDVNEVLMYLGPDVLKEVIENAEIYPIQGLFNFSHYFNEIDAYYHHTLGFELGVSTGWRGLNGLYNGWFHLFCLPYEDHTTKLHPHTPHLHSTHKHLKFVFYELNGQQVRNHVCILDFAIQRMKMKQFYGEWFSLDSLKYAIISKTCYRNALLVSTTCTMNMTSEGSSIITISSRKLKFSLDGLFGI
ncbi:hypothetical protein PVL29_013463 [Vitis rotundifolia]|uniref:Uncharacterized protein n=1 Tax=Vitis rotundifolia TaxID=103349 RepID=A0AA38ZLQ7_VITRO|nr:hypothetical protein PVL29_013463 [Vitis rotundifolia]